MKTIIILGALVLSTGAFAQGRPQAPEKIQTDIKQSSEKGQQMVKERVDQSKEEVTKFVEGKKEEASDVKAEALERIDSQDKTEMINQKMNEGRSAEAKMKAKEVKTEAEAEAMIKTSKAETLETMSSVDGKIANARQMLTDKLKSGELTQAQFNKKMVTLIGYEKRKISILNSMK